MWNGVQSLDREREKNRRKPRSRGGVAFALSQTGLELLEKSDLVLTLESDNVSMRSLLLWAGAIDFWLEQGEARGVLGWRRERGLHSGRSGNSGVSVLCLVPRQ